MPGAYSYYVDVLVCKYSRYMKLAKGTLTIAVNELPRLPHLAKTVCKLLILISQMKTEL